MMSDKYLVWIDLEMTGLNPDYDVILEIATLITDNKLLIVAEGPTFVIHQSDDMLARMDDWNRHQHGKTGLIEQVKTSTVSLAQAYEETLAFITMYCAPKTALLCGNSVYQDRNFLRRYMPDILTFLNYRIIDVSSIKEVVRRWYPNNPFVEFQKPENHRALDDIRASVAELAYYREHFFINER